MFCVHAATFLNRLPYSPDYNASRCMQTVNAITVVTLAMLQEYELHGIFRGCCSVGFRWQDMENTHLREHLQVCHTHAANASNTENETKRNETKRNETKRNETKRNETKRKERKEKTTPFVVNHQTQTMLTISCHICTAIPCTMQKLHITLVRQKAGFRTASANSMTHSDASRRSVSDCATQACRMKGAAMSQAGLQSC